MPNLNTQFQGQTLSRPGAYYGDDVSGSNTSNPGLVPPLVLIGYGFGCAPKTPITFASTGDLQQAVRGGPIADFIPFVGTPAPDGGLNGANQITFINAGANTQATYTLMSTAATPAALIVLTTKDYGSPSNLMQVAIGAGSNGLTNTRSVTLYDAYSNVTRQGDNLGVPFTLTFLGTTSGVTYTVAKTGGLATALTITSSNAAESVTIPLGDGLYDTVESVVAYLNGTASYSATIQNDGSLPSKYLDAAAAAPLGVNTPVNVTSYVPDLFHWFDQYASDLVTPALANGLVTSATTIPAMTVLTHFSGGTCVPPILADYAAAFNVALAVPGFAVFADSNSAGVRALGTQHVIQASSVTGRRPRRFFTGSSVGDTVVTAAAAAQSMSAEAGVFAYPGIYRTDTKTGRNRLYGGLYVAAAAAAMACGNVVATPLTNKALQSNGVELVLTPSQIDTLQRSGVMPIARSDDNATTLIVSDITTWQADGNVERVFSQQVACRQWLNYLLTAAAQPFTGEVAYQGGLGIMRNAVIKCLNAAIYAPGTNGVLAAWDTGSLALTYTGAPQTTAIKVNVQFVGQNRFITITVPVTALNLTA